MSLKKTGLIVAFATVLFAFWLYEPLYPGIESIGMLRVVIALNKMINMLGGATETLGLASCVNFTRITSKFIIPQSGDTSTIQIINDNFEGVPVRIFRPILKDSSPQDELPGMVFIHGGGWVLLNVDVYHTLAAKMAKQTGHVVVSVEYRLAPEHKFPIPFDDCLTAAVHLLRHGSDYAVDVKRISVVGDSAGGNLAAAVSLRLAAETALPPLKAQVLIYPALQAFDFRLPSMLTRELPGFLTQKTIIHYWLLYYQGHSDNLEKFMSNNHTSASLKSSEYGDAVDHSLLPEKYRKELMEKPQKNFGDEKLSDTFEQTLLNPYFNPLLAQRLDNLPPTFMITTEFDVLRDEGFMYAKRLLEAGVHVEHKHFEKLFHGFINLDHAECQQEFLTLLGNFLEATV